ncbi:transposase [Siccirubricoccus sp. KC 17139]|uniref:Transposase n=1 Tax=Siccirubricoccus soli TaxID=2899147 RepID=A0ABT1D711_9PROT|nr:transposase [Siccirubricoccus soli]MCO6417712.1 transposase [Siccirubricoccus soli]MCP2683847.1 transposase [Siccirubricoccus soli]
MRPRRLLPPDLFPASLLPREFLTRRLVLDPVLRLTPPTIWAPLTEEEWAAIAPIFAAAKCAQADGPGRPMRDSPRARLDAIFRACTLKRGGLRAPWADLPPEFGKPDTASRSHRRWGKAGLWAMLLIAVARRDRAPVWDGLAYRVCCAFRRAIRLMGLAGIMLAKRLRMPSALPGPSTWLPDVDLSEIYREVIRRILSAIMERPWRPPAWIFRLMRRMLGFAAGRSRIPRWAEPA